MPRGRPRGRIRATSHIARTPTPAQNADASEEDNQEETAPQTPGDGGEEEQADGGGDDDSDAAEAEQPSDHSSPPQVQVVPRKRRLGRPPKNRPPDWDTPREDDRRSDVGTPQRRKRGRPAGGGTRGRPRSSMSTIRQVRVDKEGTMMDVINDEVDLPEDPEGEEKVDKHGNLLGGRDYRVRTFTVLNRADRLYMLSTEPARCCGFRDSYLFFAKHMQLHKVIVEEDEKRDLIARDIIPHSYKGRSIGVVTARSVFREFGARIIIGGRRVIDDYYAQAARDRGDAEGELADPSDKLPPEGEPYNKNQYVAWHGASAVYHQSSSAQQTVNGKPIPGKRKVQITSANWQFEHARAASRFNSVILGSRRANQAGVYDPHTNLVLYPKTTQPTHAKWEQLPSPPDQPAAAAAATHTALSALTNGISNVSLDTLPLGDPHHALSTTTSTLFPPLPPTIPRNFLVTDTHFVSPPTPGLGIPGPDGSMHDVGPNGLPPVSDGLLAELPAECRDALLMAKAREAEWKGAWRGEAADGMRASLAIRFLGFPN